MRNPAETGSVVRTRIDALLLESLAQGIKLMTVSLVYSGAAFHRFHREDANEEHSDV